MSSTRYYMTSADLHDLTATTVKLARGGCDWPSLHGIHRRLNVTSLNNCRNRHQNRAVVLQ
eukprot:2653140-Amphidinium_carterae.1